MSESIAPRPGGGGRSVGGYELVCEITRGVLGTLWVARSSGEGRPAAALVRRVPAAASSKKTQDRIADGADWAAHGNDPRLPAVIEITRGDDDVAIANPFVEGEPLRALLRAAAFKREALGTAVSVRVAVETLELLQAVHDRTKYDPMHRAFGGLQPDSIFIATDGLPRLLDVGVAVACNEAALFMKEAQWIAYLAPEQLSGREATAATDVFSMGAILWEMLANRRLFAGATPDSVRQRVKDGPIQRLDELRGLGAEPLETPIADVVARALERDPGERYASAAEMSDALRAAVEPASKSQVAAAVEQLASQFLEKRRAVLEKAGIEPKPLDGRTDFVERQETASPRTSMRPEAAQQGGLSALTRQSAVGSAPSSRTPPPPPSKRGTSLPPAPPSARGSLPPQSRQDRALALAKAASVVAPAPPRSVPPPASSSPPPAAGAAAPSSPAQPSAPPASAPVGAVAPTGSSSEAAAPPGAASAAATAAAPGPEATAASPPAVAAGATEPAASAPVVPSSSETAAAEASSVAAALGAEPGASAPSDASAAAAPSAPQGQTLPASSPAASVEAAAPAFAAAMQSASPQLGTARSLELEATTGSGMASGIADDDEDLAAAFARPKPSRKLIVGAIGAVALVIIAVVAFSGGGESDAPSSAAPPPAEAPVPPSPVKAEAPAKALDPPPSEEEPADDEPAPAPVAEPEENSEDEAEKEPEAKAKPSPKPVRRPRPRAAPAPRQPRTAAPATHQDEPAKDVGASFKPGGI